MNKDLLYKLLETPSVSGNELEIQKVVMKEMKPYVDTFLTHHSYNVISVLNPESSFKVLMSGHIDEIGLVITDVCDNGLCKVAAIGSPNAYMYAGHHVQVITKKGVLKGVFANNVNKNNSTLEFSDLNLDLGVYSKEETMKLVSVGDWVVHEFTYQQINEHIFTGRALDDKLGAFIILEALKKVRGTKLGIYAATSVGEETTARGATFAATNVSPNLAIVVDVTHATDHTGKAKNSGYVTLGKGPAITIGSIINSKLLELVEASSKRLGINLQYEVAFDRTYTDTDKIFALEKGIPSILISIPLRYMHSSVEVCDFRDVEDIINLISDLILHLDESISFNPFE